MSFTSISFLIFIITFFAIYWGVFSSKATYQNIFILLGSYVFYAIADWRFLLFLICVCVLNYFLGIFIQDAKHERSKKIFLTIGVFQGIGCLVLFKYTDFLILTTVDFLHFFHINVSPHILNLIAPLGVSFFTFKTISYLLDINKGKIEATRDWVAFFIYVSFFPTIMSGPIDKAKAFIPQLLKLRVFDYDQAAEGMRQILWGIFKKSVIADNCAVLTNPIFGSYMDQRPSSLLLVFFLYPIQLYADFSGYSDIAIGVSRLLGINVTKNFNYPFFSQNVAEYWRRWHMSLTSWLTEYVFTPLSITFRNYGKLGLILAIMINLITVGIWHGANWNFVLFGVLHGLYFIPLILSGSFRKKDTLIKERRLPTVKEFLNILLTYILIAFALIIFKMDNIQQVVKFYKGIFAYSIFYLPQIDFRIAAALAFFLVVFFIFDWTGRRKEFPISQIGVKWPVFFRWAIYIFLFISILTFKAVEQKYIYLKF